MNLTVFNEKLNEFNQDFQNEETEFYAEIHTDEIDNIINLTIKDIDNTPIIQASRYYDLPTLISVQYFAHNWTGDRGEAIDLLFSFIHMELRERRVRKND